MWIFYYTGVGTPNPQLFKGYLYMKYYHVSLCWISIGNAILTKFSALTGIIYLILLHIAETPFLAFQELLKGLSLVC